MDSQRTLVTVTVVLQFKSQFVMLLKDVSVPCTIKRGSVLMCVLIAVRRLRNFY